MGESATPSVHYSAVRPTYTPDQLSTYVAKLAPSPSYTLASLEHEIQQDPLAALSTLQLRQIAFNPWGNLALHYSWHRALTLDSDELYHKIVERGLGGYCMENNAFFSNVLRSLGYQLYVTGARVSFSLDGDRDDPGFAGWQHEVIIVIINGQKYLVDVGFGSTSPLHPLPLSLSSQDQIYDSVPGAQLRLVHRPIASATTDSPFWVLESRTTSHPETWQGAYCFADVEWLPSDFEIINYRTSQDRASWFTHRLVLVRILVDEETRSKATGTVILSAEKIERREGGREKEVVLVAKTEMERVQGLKRWFGIDLRPDEQRGIRGTAAAITKPSSV